MRGLPPWRHSVRPAMETGCTGRSDNWEIELPTNLRGSQGHDSRQTAICERNNIGRRLLAAHALASLARGAGQRICKAVALCAKEKCITASGRVARSRIKPMVVARPHRSYTYRTEKMSVRSCPRPLTSNDRSKGCSHAENTGACVFDRRPPHC